jgi:hypothetical protein
MLKAFQSFDDAKTGFVATFKISSMLKSMKLVDFDKDRLARTIEQHDPDSKYRLLLHPHIAHVAIKFNNQWDLNADGELLYVIIFLMRRRVGVDQFRHVCGHRERFL